MWWKRDGKALTLLTATAIDFLFFFFEQYRVVVHAAANPILRTNPILRIPLLDDLTDITIIVA